MTDPVQAFEAGLAAIEGSYREALEAATDEPTLRAAAAKITGGDGSLTKVLKGMRDVPGDRRKELGQRANALKTEVLGFVESRLAAMAKAEREAELSAPHLDVTLPGRGAPVGRLHAITRVMDELLGIFGQLGFEVAEGPEIDLHENCFDKLGFPPDHPATDMQDTFYIRRDEKVRSLLRTHTSTVQVREMSKRKPPLAVVAPGKVYRRDDDATHSPMFHQLEGFLVDTDVTFADLKGVLTHLAQRLFHEDIEVRFRPSYFPFVEPGGEVDISCVFCEAWKHDPARTASCKVCKGTGWLEVLGCGMIHPTVFEHVGYDPEEVQGFAFGLGLDRIAMLKYGVPNIKLLFDNDIRFLTSF